jgi:hypothetical protein
MQAVVGLGAAVCGQSANAAGAMHIRPPKTIRLFNLLLLAIGILTILRYEHM